MNKPATSRRGSRILATLLSSCLLLLGFLCKAPAQTNYSVIFLPNIGPSGLTPVAINNGARVIGIYRWRDETVHSFTYRNGVINDLGTIPGYNNNLVTALNNRGQIVGYYYYFYYVNSIPIPSPAQAYLRDPDGKITLLGSLEANASTVPSAINDCGEVVGYSGDKAFVYRNGHLSELGSFQGDPIYMANSINNRGQIIAGYIHAGQARTVLISCGRMQDVQIPGAQSIGGLFINDHGQIAGSAFIPVSDPTSVHSGGNFIFIWSNGQVQSVGNFDITGFNNSGQMTGNVGGHYFDAGPFPMVFGHGGQDLTALYETYGIPEESGLVAGINNYGQVIGYGSSGVYGAPLIALLLTPIKNAPAAP